MGKRKFQDYIPDECHRRYTCLHCRAHLANHDELISKVQSVNHFVKLRSLNEYVNECSVVWFSFIVLSRKSRKSISLQQSVSHGLCVTVSSMQFLRACITGLCFLCSEWTLAVAEPRRDSCWPGYMLWQISTAVRVKQPLDGNMYECVHILLLLPVPTIFLVKGVYSTAWTNTYSLFWGCVAIHVPLYRAHPLFSLPHLPL